MIPALYWFRNDLRLSDNPALAQACRQAERLTLVHVRSPDESRPTRWGFPRWSPLRQAFRDTAVEGLSAAITARGGTLQVLDGLPAEALPALAHRMGATRIYCETVPAPEEAAEIVALREAGLEVRDLWQSSLLHPDDLPFAPQALPEVFTAFRHAVERAGVRPRAPVPEPDRLRVQADVVPHLPDRRVAQGPLVGSFPFGEAAFHGSEAAALAHVAHYFPSLAPARYKATRNGLIGTEYSTKLSPWLAIGALSPRTAYAALQAHEALHGASDGSYWIWFELLWRDFFRFWSIKHGARLYRGRGLGSLGPPGHDPAAFARWCAGQTGHLFVDAGMRELAATGYLSNRMRQVVASYLIHDLACDWRAGTAWFESRLIDYDVCSNQGNWLYLAGRGADPRQGRRFNPDKQAADYDPDGAYRAMWSAPGERAVR
jgi:deoxyribodipyrimidine photo-lyase